MYASFQCERICTQEIMDNAKDSYGFYYGATIVMLQSLYYNFHIIDRFNVRQTSFICWYVTHP